MRTFSKHRAPSTTTPLIWSNIPRKLRDRSRFSQQRRTCCPCRGRPVPRVSLKLTESLFVSLTRKMTITMDRNSNAHKKSDTPRADNWYRQRPQGSEMLFTNKHFGCYRCLWSVDHPQSPRPRGGFHTIYGCYPPGRLIPGHNWERTSLPASSTWKHKTTAKTKGSSMLWAFEMPKTKLRGYFNEVLKEWMWGPALPPNQGPRYRPLF